MAGLEGRRRATQHLQQSGRSGSNRSVSSWQPESAPCGAREKSPGRLAAGGQRPPLLQFIVRDGASASWAAGAGDRFVVELQGIEPCTP